MKLNKEEMKNVMGGQMQIITCTLNFSSGQTLTNTFSDWGIAMGWLGGCYSDPGCLSGSHCTAGGGVS
jgi:hypothetical protein